MRIRKKLGILPVTLAAITLTISLLITLIISNGTLKNQVGNHLLTTAQSRAHNIETLLNDDKDIVQVLAIGIPFTNALDPQIDYTRRMTECNLRIKRTIEVSPYINRIRILNKNGIVIASSHKDIGFDLSEKAIFIKGNESVYIGDIHKSVYTGNLAISVSAPIFVRDILSGVLIVNFDIEKKLYEILSNKIGLVETEEIYLVNKDGYIITPSKFMDNTILETRINTNQVNLFILEHIDKSFSPEMEEIPTKYSNYSGRKVLGTHYFIPEMQWGLIVEFDVKEINKPMNKLTFLLIIMFSILLIITIIVVIIISRDITLPIVKLHKGTEEIIKGNLDYKVRIESKDEIGQLSRSFDIMTGKLRKAQNKMINYTENLESKVKERTAELEKQLEKSEKQRIANLVVLNDLNTATKKLKAEITERTLAKEEKAKLEAQLRHSQKMETIGTLAGGIAHDFNNILTPILGYTEMALASLGKTDPLYTGLESIQKGGNRAKELVEQILTFSRQMEKERQPLQIQLIIKEAVNLLRASIPATIEIRQFIDSSCNKVLADPTQIHQVIMNLCTNAFQAMEEQGGILTLELKGVAVDREKAKLYPNLEEKEYTRLSISDTGAGMDKATIERIFEPFFTTKAVDKGTGMGLSVVHGIICSHGGDILVYSEPQKGSTFHVYLPVIPENKQTDKEKVTAIQDGTESILLADDEEMVSQMLQRILERLGYSVKIRNSSIKALKVFKEQPDDFDLLISDLTMPDMTGLELAGEIHKVRPELPIILMTGYGDKLSLDIKKHYGVVQVIGKPIILKELANAIRNVLDKKIIKE